MYEFTASGMTHVNPIYLAAPNRYRAMAPYVDLNVGLLEIDWDNKPKPRVAMKALGLDGQVGFQASISLRALQRR